LHDVRTLRIQPASPDACMKTIIGYVPCMAMMRYSVRGKCKPARLARTPP